MPRRDLEATFTIESKLADGGRSGERARELDLLRRCGLRDAERRRTVAAAATSARFARADSCGLESAFRFMPVPIRVRACGLVRASITWASRYSQLNGRNMLMPSWA